MQKGFVSFSFDFEHNSKESLKDILKKDLSRQEIEFDAERWVCEKKAIKPTDEANKYTIYFANTPKAYSEWIRYFALVMFEGGARVKTVKENVGDIKTFFQFLHENYNSIPFEKVSYTEINKYKEYLDHKYNSVDTKHSKWSAVSNFYRKMKGADGFFKENIVPKNPFEKKRNNPDKYIPKDVADQLDIAFQDDNVPIPMRTAYWIMRFIPSRLGEVVRLPINCVKDVKDSWVITLYMWKQNGGYFKPELRTVRFKNESKEATFLYKLIKQQEEIAKSLQNQVPDDAKGYLFTYNKTYIHKRASEIAGKIKYRNDKVVVAASFYSISHFMEQFCDRYGVVDKDGETYHLTTHKLRHNGITDRIVEGGFEVDDVMAITNHKVDMMINRNYFHEDKNKSIEVQENVLKASGKQEDESQAVYFKGRIMNIDESMQRRLLRDIRKHKVKLGICMDIDGCDNYYRCLSCEHFAPKAEDLHYFENEIEQWQRKLQFYRDKGMTMQMQNAEYNLNLNAKIRDRIVNNLDA